MVNGASWKAASELKDGQKLDGLSAPRPVEAVSDGKGTESYSLVVADVPTFFVDRMGVLAHDASR
jgi:hypothetical protein